MYKMTVSFFKVMMHGGKISTEEIINKNLLTCIQDSNLTGLSTVNNSGQYRYYFPNPFLESLVTCLFSYLWNPLISIFIQT